MAESGSNPAMDQAAEHARNELVREFARWDAVAVSAWWKKWYLKAGHKRLGRVLLELTGKKTVSGAGTSTIKEQSAKTVDLPQLPTLPESNSPLDQISKASALIRRAEQTVLDDLESGRVKDEEGITERLIGAIHQQFNDRVYAGIRWAAMTLTAHKRNAQETWYGADLLGVLQVDLEDYSVQKGFLVQAKYIRRSEWLNPSEFTRLKQQCAKMLSHSNASYVFVYEPAGISVLPAVAIASLNDGGKLPDLKRRGLVEFFKEHFDCFVGDLALHSPSDRTLENLREKVAARQVIRLLGKLDQ